MDPGIILTFILMQHFPNRKKCHYTTQEQRLCLTMHYTSPALYNKLRDILFQLPCPSIIIRWFGVIDIWPGICQHLFNALAVKAANLDAFDRNRVLSFDEMTIKMCFSFHSSKQMIEGFEDLGFLDRSNAGIIHYIITILYC